MNFETYDNNRSKRLKVLIDSYDKISFNDFKIVSFHFKVYLISTF